MSAWRTLLHRLRYLRRPRRFDRQGRRWYLDDRSRRSRVATAARGKAETNDQQSPAHEADSSGRRSPGDRGDTSGTR